MGPFLLLTAQEVLGETLWGSEVVSAGVATSKDSRSLFAAFLNAAGPHSFKMCGEVRGWNPQHKKILRVFLWVLVMDPCWILVPSQCFQPCECPKGFGI